MQGEYRKAEEWLGDAEMLVSDLARPNFIRGMMLGAQGRDELAVVKLSMAIQGRAKAVTKERIHEVLAFAEESA